MAEFGIRIMLLLAACLLPLSGEAMVRYYKFNAKEAHFGGMHISSGLGPLSMVPWSSCPSLEFRTLFPNQIGNKLSY
ncbi:hypothetical protein GLYMA_06G284300v4 [Glycine max]|nr:hypothetical protein GLYMA_06G284300v4 [Glycine max]KAH1127985.1 hypothetical protein GYH30_016527 [Glycine max]